MNGSRWRSVSYGVGGLVALAILFLAVVMLSNLGLRGMRADLTQNRLYTLSPGTQQVLTELKEPVNLYFYFSRAAASKQAPLLMPYATRVREFLEELAARSGGKVHVTLVDPQPFSDEEDRAAEFGLRSLHAGGGEALYFGLAGTNSTDGRSSIPSFQAEREEFLEYDVAKLIHELGAPKKPVIGLMSSLGLQGQFNPMTGQMGEPWPILTQLQELFTVRTLTLDVDHIDKDIDVLMLVHPKGLQPKALYAIDQFVMRGGRMLIFVDPNAGGDTSGQDPSNPLAGAMADHSSDLKPLFAAWGVDYDPTQVIGDLERGLEVRTSMQSPPVRPIGILGLGRADMNQKDVVSASLDKINLATAGSLAAHPGAKTNFEPLLLSSASAAPIPAQRFNALTDPSTLRDGFKPTGGRYALAARVTGAVESAYPQGSPADQKAAATPSTATASPAGTPAGGPPATHLAKSAAPANIVIIADTDMLMDYMWVQTRELFGQRIAQAFASNGDFIANILDNLSGSSALISVRGRATFSRPFERVEALRRQADDRLRAKALELQAKLQQTEKKLTELQNKRNDQSSLMLSPEQEAELKQFVAEKAQVRRELRDTQRGLDVDINRLNSWLKVINIAIAPLCLAAAGVIILSRRRRRRTAAQGVT
ncbi:MAG: GldG family protein [Steroidobacteraceae bacterium]